MTKSLVLAFLLAPAALALGSSPADAGGAAKAVAQPAPILIAEVHQGLGIDVGDAGFQILEDGHYRVYRHDPKAMASLDRTGRLAPGELAEIRAALKHVPWKVTHSEVTCDALAMAHTVWTAGTRTFDQRLCGSDAIDATTAKLFARIDALETRYATKP